MGASVIKFFGRPGVVVLAMVLAGASALAQSAAPQTTGSASDIEVEGVLEVVVRDHREGASVHRFLQTTTERLELTEAPGRSALGDLQSGSVIRARGRRGPNSTLELQPNSTGGSVTTLSLASPNTFGEQRVVIILVNFQDKPSAPYSWSQASQVTFGSVSDFFRDNSYGQTWLTGDVFGWFTIAENSTSCDQTKIYMLADQAAANAGVNLSNYTRRVYAFPQNACSFWGSGTVGGNPSRAWINGSYALKVVAHELGHNFGDWHSKSEPCDAAGCSIIEYGDDRDIMGLSGTGHLNAYQKERLGWLNYGASPGIQTISASGTYWIDSLQTPGGVKALKILKSASSGGNIHYYLESRSQLGFDAGYAPGVIVHTGHESNTNSSQQTDLDRLTSAFDAILNAGQSFTDSTAGLTVRTISADSAGAWLSVDYAGVPCTQRAPTVTLSPGGTVTTSPSATVSYSLSIRNNDDAGCAAANFAIGMAVPSGWTWSTSTGSVFVSAGASASVSLNVTTSATASGTATVTAQTARTGTSGPGGSAVGNLVVVTELSVSLAISSGNQYQLTATVLSGGQPASGISVKFTLVSPSGGTTTLSGTTNGSGVATVKGRLKPRDARGTYTVTARASFGALVGSATGTFVY